VPRLDRPLSVENTPKPPAPSRWARALPLVAGALLLGFAGWTMAVARDSALLRDASSDRVRWLRQLQDSVHVLQTHNPEEPQVERALIRLDEVAAEVGRDSNLDSLAASLHAATAGLRQGLEDGQNRTELRQNVFRTQERLGAAIWMQADTLRDRWTAHSTQVLILAILSVGLGGCGLGLAWLASSRRREASALGEELEVALEVAQHARDVAESASRAKSDFLATMSHEIRTPLTAILGTVELLGQAALKPAQREHLDIVDQAGESLLSLIDDVLDLSRIESGTLELRRDTFDLEMLVDGIALLFAGRAEARGLQLNVVLGGGVPRGVEGDSDRLRQVLFNLIGNALKFTDTGHVRIDIVALGGDRLKFTVQDTGVGMPEGFAADAFEPFTQADPSSTRRHGGAGLGLAIVSRIVQAAGGTVSFESRPGEGTTFDVELPLPARGASQRPRIPSVCILGSDPAAQALVDQLRAWGADVEQNPDVPGADRVVVTTDGFGGPDALDVGAFASGSRLTWPVRPGLVRRLFQPPVASDDLQAVAPRPTVTSLHVLLVDDNEINRIVLGGMLDKLGCTVDTACDGADALNACMRTGYELIFMDCDMPEVDGLAATQALRSTEGPSSDTPVVGISGHAGGRAREEALAAGMDSYLSKPLRLADLSGAIAEFAPDALLNSTG
jgi:signal transduction histidine kinase/CheY-like chemotaxis protein